MSIIQPRLEAEFFVGNLRTTGLRKAVAVLVHNLRFGIGYWIGGFTSARRDW